MNEQTKAANQLWTYLYGDEWPEGLRVEWRKNYASGHRGRTQIVARDRASAWLYQSDDWRKANIDRSKYWIALNPKEQPCKPGQLHRSRSMPEWFADKWLVWLNQWQFIGTLIHEFTHVRGRPDHSERFWKAFDATLDKFVHSI